MLDLETLAIRFTTEGDAALRASLKGIASDTSFLHDKFNELVVLVTSVELWKHIIEGSTEAGEAMLVMSQKTGESVENLSAMQYAAKQSGTSVDALEMGLRFLSRAMQGVNMETGLGVKAFEAMNIKTTDVKGNQRGMRDVLMDVADRFATYADGAGKSALAIDLFGRSGQSLIPFLNQGSKGIDELMKRAGELGIVMTTQTANSLKDYGDKLKEIKDQLASASQQITMALQPALEQLTGAFGDAMAGGGFLATFINYLSSVIDGAVYVFNFFGDLVVGVIATVLQGLGDLGKGLYHLVTLQFEKAANDAEMSGVHLRDNFKAMGTAMGEDADTLREKLHDLWAEAAPPDTPGHGAPKKPPPNITKPDLAGILAARQAELDLELQLARDDYDKKHALLVADAEFKKSLGAAGVNDYKKSLAAIDKLDEEHEKETDKIFSAIEAAKADAWNKLREDKEKGDKEQYARDLKNLEDFLKGVVAGSDKYFAQIRRAAGEWSAAISNVITASFTAAFSGKGIKGIFQAFGDAVLSALGGIFARIGEAWLTYGLTQLRFMAAIFADPIGGAGYAIAMGAALIALGATLGAIGHGGAGGAGGGSSAFTGTPAATVPQGPTQFIFGANSATTAAGMQPRQAVNMVVIGPGDPTAMRQIQELLNNANRRG